MKKFMLLTIMSVFLAFISRGYGHSFSTSFLTVQEQGVVKYQVSFHDLAALNPSWLEGKPIDATLLNNHLEDIESFIQRVVVVNNSNCDLKLAESSPWSATTHANQSYIVIEAQAQCNATDIDDIEVHEVWNEFPDHRVITQITLPGYETSQRVLSERGESISF
ncbi:MULTISPECIES: hypothetical protein [Gammaproteobacteria]|uniref:hypothetical protein n=1 Tax=Gammaproteobacteria TaxID=1236 RepID=UPI000DD0D9D3|nr:MULTISPECIES: hypothetical protein [Gammaproteobacteria]RTE86586.1 hypothetical protein DQX04_08510 [Aliidiomarina sp. B3213]TCZ90859.1 hypothetical protein EYQ95_08535 [Lysobacter sp. N42]